MPCAPYGLGWFPSAALWQRGDSELDRVLGGYTELHPQLEVWWGGCFCSLSLHQLLGVHVGISFADACHGSAEPIFFEGYVLLCVLPVTVPFDLSVDLAWTIWSFPAL